MKLLVILLTTYAAAETLVEQASNPHITETNTCGDGAFYDFVADGGTTSAPAVDIGLLEERVARLEAQMQRLSTTLAAPQEESRQVMLNGWESMSRIVCDRLSDFRCCSCDLVRRCRINCRTGPANYSC